MECVWRLLQSIKSISPSIYFRYDNLNLRRIAPQPCCTSRCNLHHTIYSIPKSHRIDVWKRNTLLYSIFQPSLLTSACLGILHLFNYSAPSVMARRYFYTACAGMPSVYRPMGFIWGQLPHLIPIFKGIEKKKEIVNSLHFFRCVEHDFNFTGMICEE